MVHRRVRVLEQRVAIGAVVGIEGEAEAAAYVDLVRLDLEGAPHFVEDLARDVLRRAFVGQVLEHDHELVARDAREHVAFAQRPTDAPRELLQERVAHAVAERVVHVLEVVEVEEHHRHAPEGAARARERGGEAVVEEHGVG